MKTGRKVRGGDAGLIERERKEGRESRWGKSGGEEVEVRIGYLENDKMRSE